MTRFTRAMAGGAAAAAVALAATSPAIAGDRSDIGTNDIIAGALILGGIAAASGALGGGRDDDDAYGRYDDRRYDDRRYDGRYGNSANPRRAVEQCVRTAESNARGYGRAEVTEVHDVKRTRRGFEVKGQIAVSPDRRGRDRRRGNGWGDDYRGYDDSGRGHDSGNFQCRVERDRVVALDYSGIRGL